VLIFAEKIDDKLVERADEPEIQQTLSTLIKGIYPDSPEAYVWTGDHTIKWPGFEVMAQSSATKSSAKSERGRRFRMAGAVIGGIGLVSLGTSFAVAIPGADTAGDTPVDTLANENRAAAAGAMRGAGVVLAGAGLLTVGISLPIGGGK
jgi:hypothetical protein